MVLPVMAGSGGLCVIAYRDATPADGAELAQVARRCFTETFGALYRQEDLARFLDDAFGVNGLPSHPANPAYQVRLACSDGAIVGFCKIGPLLFPGDWPASAIELHQLYVLGPWQGQGVAPVLMDWAIGRAREQDRSEMILSVYVDNHRARRFYERYGFVEIGQFTFMVGDHPDDDRLMRLTL